MKIELDGRESRRELEAVQAALTHLLSTHREAESVPPGLPLKAAHPTTILDPEGDAIGDLDNPKPESGSDGIAEDATTSGPAPQTTPLAGSPADAQRKDTKGVPFNAEKCSVAAEPFYGSGPRLGQWKKRKGVDDAVYDAWYSDELAKLTDVADEDSHTPAPVSTAAAFGAPQPQSSPQTTGEFMGWVSEKQAAGLLTQNDIQDAYMQTGVQVVDLFPPTDPEVVSQHVAKLYGILSTKAGA